MRRCLCSFHHYHIPFHFLAKIGENAYKPRDDVATGPLAAILKSGKDRPQQALLFRHLIFTLRQELTNPQADLWRFSLQISEIAYKSSDDDITGQHIKFLKSGKDSAQPVLQLRLFIFTLRQELGNPQAELHSTVSFSFLGPGDCRPA